MLGLRMILPQFRCLDDHVNSTVLHWLRAGELVTDFSRIRNSGRLASTSDSYVPADFRARWDRVVIVTGHTDVLGRSHLKSTQGPKRVKDCVRSRGKHDMFIVEQAIWRNLLHNSLPDLHKLHRVLVLSI